jgi:hypothetical protein
MRKQKVSSSSDFILVERFILRCAQWEELLVFMGYPSSILQRTLLSSFFCRKDSFLVMAADM